MKTMLPRLLLAALLLTSAASLRAQSMMPSAMNYQGFLTDTNGDPVAPVAPENRNIEFRIYNQAAGGSALWGEAQTVTVFKGNFSVILGNGTSLSGLPSGPAAFAAVFSNLTSPDVFFGITPQGGSEFVPRQKILPGAFALRARQAESVLQTSGTSQFSGLVAGTVRMQGPLYVDGGNQIVFGENDPSRPKTGGAGAIGYQFASNGFDIVGAGPSDAERRITMFAEAGTTFTGPILMGANLGQHINLFENKYGIGIQPNAMYHRTDGNFHWFAGGTHANADNDPGGGTRLATLNTSGFTLRSGKFTGDGSGLTNLNLALPDNYNYLAINGAGVLQFGRGVSGREPSAGQIGYGTHSNGEFLDIVGAGTGANRRIKLYAEGGLSIDGPTAVNGSITPHSGHITFPGHSNFASSINGGHAFGSQHFTTFSRSGDVFAWYLGGSYVNERENPGGGRMLAKLDQDGLFMEAERLTMRSPGLGTNWQLEAGFDFAVRQNGTARVYLRGGMGGEGWFNPSDRRLKEDIATISGALDTVMSLRPTSYKFKSAEPSTHRSLGFIAQEVQEVLPDVVATVDKDTGTLGLNYNGFIPITVAAVQEQQAQIESLSSENATLKERLARLEAKMDQLLDTPPATEPDDAPVGAANE